MYAYLIWLSCSMFKRTPIAIFSSKAGAFHYVNGMKERCGGRGDFTIQTYILDKPLYNDAVVETCIKYEVPREEKEPTTWKDQGMQ